MRFRSLFLGLCALELCAQEALQRTEAPPWGVALLAGRETGDSEHAYGDNYGVEGSWQFLRDHWVQGRVRGALLKIERGKGSGGSEPWTYPLRGDFLVLSCDWIFRFKKAHGPYLLLGAGVNYHRVDRFYGSASDTERGVLPSLAWGVGWLISNRMEIEVRQDILMVDVIGGSRDAECTNLVLRTRF